MVKVSTAKDLAYRSERWGCYYSILDHPSTLHMLLVYRALVMVLKGYIDTIRESQFNRIEDWYRIRLFKAACKRTNNSSEYFGGLGPISGQISLRKLELVCRETLQGYDQHVWLKR